MTTRQTSPSLEIGYDWGLSIPFSEPFLTPGAALKADVKTSPAQVAPLATLTTANGGLTIVDAQTRLFAVTHLPVFFRTFNAASAPASAPNLIVSDCFIGAHDIDSNKSWEAQMAGNQQGSLVSPTTFTQTAQWANSAEAAAATLSNTAAGYASLGGRFLFNAIAGATTDYALFGFQVPAPYSAYIKGVYIDTLNIGAAAAVTATELNWSIAVNGTAVSLATASYARRALGNQSFPIGAAIGAQATPISRQFSVPIPCDAGKFIAVILRMPLGTATASQQLQGVVDIDGWFE